MFPQQGTLQLNQDDPDSAEKELEAPESNFILPRKNAEDNETSGFKMEKRVGLIDGIALIIGTMIGSGIFASPRSVFANSGSAGLALIIWGGCGFIAIGGALCYVELGLLTKESGGERTYLALAFGDCAGFVFSWTAVTVLKTSSISAIAYACGEYVAEAIFSGCGKSKENVLLVKLIAALVIGLPRYWWIFGSNFLVDSPHPPKYVHNTMTTYGQQHRF